MMKILEYSGDTTNLVVGKEADFYDAGENIGAGRTALPGIGRPLLVPGQDIPHYRRAYIRYFGGNDPVPGLPGKNKHPGGHRLYLEKGSAVCGDPPWVWPEFVRNRTGWSDLAAHYPIHYLYLAACLLLPL